MFFQLGNHVENTLCNFWVKRCGIHIEYTKYFAHCGKYIKFVPNCAEYFMYSIGILHLFTQKLHNVFSTWFPRWKNIGKLVCFNNIKNNKLD